MHDPREIELLRWLLPVGSERSNWWNCSSGQASDPLSCRFSSNVFQQCGFVFRQTEKTICIVKEPESLVPEMILAGLRTNTIGRDVLVFRETSSTNDRVRQAGVAGAREGLVYLRRKPDQRPGNSWPEMDVIFGGRSLVFDSPPHAISPASQWPLLVPDGGCRLRRSG